jgi:hypothetical protein
MAKIKIKKGKKMPMYNRWWFGGEELRVDLNDNEVKNYRACFDIVDEEKKPSKKKEIKKKKKTIDKKIVKNRMMKNSDVKNR